MVDLLQLVQDAIGNPVVYFLLVFVFAILAAIVLPVPIELALIPLAIDGSLPLIAAAVLAIASGKAVGAGLVFRLGIRVETVIERWTEGDPFLPFAYREMERHGLLEPPPLRWLVGRVAAVLREKDLPRQPSLKPLLRRTVRALERLVRTTGALGLYVLLSIPLMTDTVPLYFYAVFNEEGRTIRERSFIASNFLAGATRVAIVLVAFVAFGVTIA